MLPLTKACEVLDLYRDATLAVRARLALAVCHASLGHEAKALRGLASARPMYSRMADSSSQMAHVTWMEGKVALLAGNVEEAPALLDTARKSFLRLGKLYEAGFASLDLAAAWAKRGRLESMSPLIYDVPGKLPGGRGTGGSAAGSRRGGGGARRRPPGGLGRSPRHRGRDAPPLPPQSIAGVRGRAGEGSGQVSPRDRSQRLKVWSSGAMEAPECRKETSHEQEGEHGVLGDRRDPRVPAPGRDRGAGPEGDPEDLKSERVQEPLMTSVVQERISNERLQTWLLGRPGWQMAGTGRRIQRMKAFRRRRSRRTTARS